MVLVLDLEAVDDEIICAPVASIQINQPEIYRCSAVTILNTEPGVYNPG